MNKTLEFLLDNACPSIEYRIKKEVLNEIGLCEKRELQSQILEDSVVQGFLKSQNTDGWIDEDFHSEKGVETAIRVLSEKGVSSEQSLIQKMLNELEKREETFDKGCLFNVGKVLDEKGFGGSQLIRATIFTYAGIENKEFIKKQIKYALDKFKFVLTIDKIDDITEQYKNKLVFKDEVKWPSIYDLRLLAFTKEWRSTENKRMVISSIRQLVKLSPIPDILVLKGHQLIAPASFCMHDFNPYINTFEDKDWMIWFHRMELLSRLGVVNHIGELKDQVDFLTKVLRENNGIFKKKLSHYYFTKWGTYTGLALEKDWKSEKRRICDLTFRSLLILHYSEIY
ncbi:hypothetical protein KQI42_03925 [Tissierella sp. MSJ-40]|uniref:Uncharacterized protein n=1 Tax=Tissierella simiarum TaxID=2841534 RepID=A0ABS6E2L9_9FIRM|nr:hypothetical protein [Tissierella simiarum]MBU5437144.1 hypothetical protein [Tissierella simiarum]